MAIEIDESTLKARLRDAINYSLSTCESNEARTAVAGAIVEFFCAIGLDDDDYVEILSNCGGTDVDIDDTIEVLIKEFSE